MADYDAQTKTWNGPIQPSILNPEANLGQIFLDQLSRTPSKLIQINADDGSEMTCAEMKLRMVRVALNLKILGYKKGDFVSLVCSNSENVTPVYGGCWLIGLVVSPIAPMFNESDMAHLMRFTQSKVVFCDEANRETVERAIQEAIKEKPRIYVMGKSAGSAVTIDELLTPVDGEECFESKYLGDSKKLIAAVLSSSGTTGPPKGVCLSHAFLIEGEMFSDEQNAGPVLNFSPLFWITGLFAALTSLLYPRTRVITTQPFTAEAFFSIIDKYQVEYLFTPPSYVPAIQGYSEYQTSTLSSVKRWVFGGAPVSSDLLASLADRFRHVDVKPALGCSEIGVVTSPMKPFARGSVGTLTRNISVKVVDEDGHRLGPNEKGEICIKSKHKFLGYLNDEEATRKACDEEDFFKTGDIGYVDSEGYLHIIDRIKDIIKYKNYQISPSDLESVILQIKEVKQVCVTGIPTADQSSDLPVAMVVLQSGSCLSENDVLEIVNGQVSDHKRLRGGVYFSDRLPVSPAGKVLRRVVKQILLDMPNTQHL